jgi:hypothetical protein
MSPTAQWDAYEEMEYGLVTGAFTPSESELEDFLETARGFYPLVRALALRLVARYIEHRKPVVEAAFQAMEEAAFGAVGADRDEAELVSVLFVMGHWLLAEEPDRTGEIVAAIRDREARRCVFDSLRYYPSARNADDDAVSGS